MPRDLTPWVRLRANAYMDPKIILAGNQAELVYYRSLQLCKQMGDTGRLHRRHIAALMRGVRGQADVVTTLLEHELWISCSDSAYLMIRSWEKHNGEPLVSEEKPEKPVDAPPRARVRERQDKTRQEESFRSPSGSDRNDSARAAPRSAGGAARPAPKNGEVRAPWDPDDGDMVEPAEDARARIRETNARSKKATGRNPMQSKWNRQQEERHSFEANMARMDEMLGGGAE